MPEPKPERQPDLARKIQREFGIILIKEGDVDFDSDMYNATLENLYKTLKALKKIDEREGNQFIRGTSIFISDEEPENATPDGIRGHSVKWGDTPAAMLKKLQIVRKKRGEIFNDERKTLPLDADDEDNKETFNTDE
ncbi:hypothetical protein KKC88_04655 [Patescibacteria group bacterium]|nr:hypothetical protein [Patescibacteria group bacterium]MBU1674021.1 hypothetical protein [Patescibacteria group bacterium]MBU1963175.1 hypothetical protein [Patescibacteria group bacterium]